MPELPEVEAARRLLTRAAVGRRIVTVRCARDPIVFQGVSPTRVQRALRGRRIVAARRHGKHLWLELDRRPWPCFHFGMAGSIEVRGRRRARLVLEGRKSREGIWPPRFCRLHLVLDDGAEVVFRDARRLGRVRLRHDPRSEPPISLLGFDALHELPSARRLAALLGARGAPVKAVLLDQSFSAGVGNWIADEVLYQARIAPRRPARSLSDRELDRLRTRLRSVVRAAVEARADSDRYPRSWLFHRRWDRRPGITVRGDAIRRETIAGRTAAWVPALQR